MTESGGSAPDRNTARNPAANGAMPTDHTSGVVKASTMMAMATLVSRGTGFLAKVVILAFLGFSIVNDSYNLANTLPNIVFELLIGGVLTSVAIPLLSRARSDPDGGVRYTQQLMTLMIVGLVLATALAIAAAPLLTRLYLHEGDTTDPVLATNLAYLLLPQIFFYGVAALFGAILNTSERFAAPAWAPVANNIVVIAVGIILIATSAGSDGGLTTLSRGQFLLLGLGTTAGIVVQALIMLPALRRSGFRFGWQWGIDARMRQAGALAGWAIVYVLVSQVGYVAITQITSYTRHGLFSLYAYGSMLFQLPYGILGVSLLTAIMPRMSRHAAAGNMPAVKRDMALANRLSAVALLPVTAAMIALAMPLAVVTARYGNVTASDARILAATLAAFAIGLTPLAITLVQMRVFYAMADGRTPAIINAIMVAVRIPLLLACLTLPADWVVPGLAAAMSASYVVGVAVGEIWLHVRFGKMGFAGTLDTIARTALASAAGGAAAYLVTSRLDTDSFGGAIAALAAGGIVGLVVVIALLLALRVEEVSAIMGRWRGRAGGATGGPEAGAGPAGIGPAAGAGLADAAGPAGMGQAAADDGEVSDARSDDAPLADPRHATPERARQEPAKEASYMYAGLNPGAIVGERYRLTRRIGSDSAGNEFWQARDTVLPRDMAVTILPATEPTSATVTRTLRVGRLGHPGLPQTLDMGAAGPSAYLAGLWVDGATVTDLLGDGPLEPAIARRIIGSVAEAVGAVHEAGIALGALHPSLVRVNFEGQVRLSHVTSSHGAAPEDDIRAVGGLLYLMLTGTWPLAPGDGPAGVPAAPRRGDRAVLASKVQSGIPAALAKITDRALHPEGARGVEDLAALAALADPSVSLGEEDLAAAGARRRGRGGGPGAGSGGAGSVFGGGSGAGSAPGGAGGSAPGGAGRRGPVTGPEQRVMRDRRIKLSIAGAMLAVLALLIVIMGSSVVKQMLASIVEPINAADRQELVTGNVPTTTRSVGTPGPDESSASTGPDASGGEQSSTADEGTVRKIVDAFVYDPQGDGSKDYESYVDQTFDGDPATAWLTWVYRQQFGPGGIKDGVGVMIQLAKAVNPRTVTVTSTTAGTDIEIRSATGPDVPLDQTTVLATATLGTDPVSIALDEAPKSKYLIVWITKLADYRGDTAANKGQFQSTIAEISVTG